MNIILSGGTGFIGKAVIGELVEKGHRVTLLTRHPDKVKHFPKNFVKPELWDGRTLGPWAERMNEAEGVINLAGESIAAKRWTSAQKSRIVSSRIDATKLIVEAIRKAGKKPAVLVNASAVGYYGNVDDGIVNETYPKGKGFLADTCEVWESEAHAAEMLGVRVVIARIGVVLEKDGGALSKMIPLFNWAAGGPIGSGRQWFPWVHRDDVAGAIVYAIENAKLRGPVNVCAPELVTNKHFSEALARALHRPCWAPVPAFVLKAAFGEMSELLLTGQQAIPQKLYESGYPFRYPKLDEALAAIFRS